MICLHLKISEKFVRLVLHDRFWVLYIPFVRMVRFKLLSGSPSPPSWVYSSYYNYFIHLRVFHTSVSRWLSTGIWMTTSLLKSPGLFSVFRLISIMLYFKWSPHIPLFPSSPFPESILWWLCRVHYSFFFVSFAQQMVFTDVWVRIIATALEKSTENSNRFQQCCGLKLLILLSPVSFRFFFGLFRGFQLWLVLLPFSYSIMFHVLRKTPCIYPFFFFFAFHFFYSVIC